ncbi:ABC transporter substrate-binding protein [Kitasatospora atroaurantiaca]|uniref:Amino acid ABC transporter substrate-binding protein (PAAT family) n=1 Tax=Kitasatospora atroaurantiaca TaxID=285545 RepID=A0A561EKJ2_9ACTN|nr:ABC transporter substrate-binding protein [Kitasatospora atroaurantiaca]TWE16120.1 amino acid ABC transporter substrate-binding protein (PAAT family) [Kitasatospora atroaurantiaca]
MTPASASRALRPAALAALLLAAAVLTACAPQDARTTDAAAPAADGCAKGALGTKKAGTLTVGTDKPAYDPWFSDDKPENGKGFESAVAFAVAEKLGYPKDKVSWVVSPFNKAFAPGAKDFDFDINQVSINDERKKSVDFSSGYYDVRQAVVALKSSKVAGAKGLADLKGAKLGAQVGTTSLATITDRIKPSAQPAVFDDNDLAKTALKNGQIDALVVDLPTAFYITGAEVTDAQVVGQLEGSGSGAEQFGLVLDKGSALTGCVTQAVDALRADGTLAKLEKQWLSDAVSAPVLK